MSENIEKDLSRHFSNNSISYDTVIFYENTDWEKLKSSGPTILMYKSFIGYIVR